MTCGRNLEWYSLVLNINKAESSAPAVAASACSDHSPILHLR